MPLHFEWATRTTRSMVPTTMDDEADRRNAATSAMAVVASTWNRTAMPVGERIAQRGRTTPINARATATAVERPTSNATIATAEELSRTDSMNTCFPFINICILRVHL